MKLYVWDNYRPDWKAGLAFAIAKNAKSARKMIMKEVGYDSDNAKLSLAEDPQVFPLNKPVAFQVAGSS